MAFCGSPTVQSGGVKTVQIVRFAVQPFSGWRLEQKLALGIACWRNALVKNVDPLRRVPRRRRQTPKRCRQFLAAQPACFQRSPELVCNRWADVRLTYPRRSVQCRTLPHYAKRRRPAATASRPLGEPRPATDAAFFGFSGLGCPADFVRGIVEVLIADAAIRLGFMVNAIAGGCEPFQTIGSTSRSAVRFRCVV